MFLAKMLVCLMCVGAVWILSIYMREAIQELREVGESKW